ncbi:amino acid adenylation domain-containing protein (plasmid) [Streptomyces decoyicus]|uniref:non-ribosomal peptide synthetase n=1 Tax=Streptomyces decoyicus TaxID=249567 RepID=UPI002E3508E9|nr:non-ribosomal peptide synthetase [Streptomyces decoyicus]
MTASGAAELPLSAGQADIWFDEKLSGGSHAYNTAGYLDITGPLDPDLLRQAAHRLVDEAQCMRSRFTEDETGPRQFVAPLTGLPYTSVDFSTHDAPEAAAAAWMRADLATPLSADTTAGDTPLFRLALLHVAEDRWYFYMCIHHLLCDGYSQVVFWRRLAELYQARLTGAGAEKGKLPPLSALLDAERAYAHSDRARRDAAFWESRFTRAPEPVTLSPHDQAPGQGFVRDEFGLSPEIALALRATARRSSVTWPTVVMAAVAAYTQRRTGARDVLLTVPVTTRVGALMRAVPGMVANTLPLHVPVTTNTTVGGLLADTSGEFARILRHQRHRVSRIRRSMGLRSDDKRPFGPLVNILPQQTRMALGPCDVTVANLSTGLIDDFELTVVDAADGGITVHLSGNANLYTARDVAEHAACLAHFVKEFVTADQDTPLGRLDLLDPLALERVLAAGHGSPATGAYEGVVERVRRVADLYPDVVAVHDDSGETTYASLVGASSALSRALTGAGRVAVLAAPGAGFVTAVLAVLGAGGAYVPFDVNAPRARLISLLRDSGARHLVADPAHAGLAREIVAAAGSTAPVLVLDGTRDPVAGLAAPVGAADDLAYVIFTSGSTGRPKGAMVHRAGMVNHLLAKVEDLNLCEGDALVQNAPVTFDISVWQMLAPLLVGGRVRVVSRAVAADPELLFPLTTDEQITVLEVVPSLLRAALDGWDERDGHPQLPLLRFLMVTGEALPGDLCGRWAARHPGIPLINAYGPTECSDDVTHAVIDARSLPAGPGAPIGRAVRGMRLVVLDDALRPVPPGTPGELYAAGVGVGRGYLDDPARTAVAFLPDPCGPPGSRMYRTGDQVVLRGDGQFEFLERRDHQVKVRGHRIELGEIEATLRRLDRVADAAVVVHTDPGGRKQLVGYPVARPGAARDHAALREELSRLLPGYMVPAHFHFLDTLPLTPHGKVDRKALPAPEFTAPDAADGPRGRAEEILCSAMAGTLGRASVGRDDSFFALGGDSISALQVVGKARREGLALSTREVFEHATPAAIAAAVGDPAPLPAAAGSLADDGVGEVELLPAADQLREMLGALDAPLREYSQHVAVEVPPDLDPGLLARALQAVLDHHDALRLTLSAPVPGLWSQSVAPPGAVAASDVLDVVDATLDERPAAQVIAALAAGARATLDPWRGTVLRAVLADLGPGRGSRLVMVAHHLAMDGVSWRIVVPDLRDAYARLAAGAEPALEPVPGSLRRWSRELSAHARSAARTAELPLWLSQLQDSTPTVGDRPLDPARDVHSTAGTLRTELPAPLTEALVTEVPALLNAEINDILLAAFALALADWQRHRDGRGEGPGPASSTVVEVEGHGREDLVAGFDISRTVGWFTSSFPVRLAPGEVVAGALDKGGPEVGAALKRVKEQLRALPDHGVGFGLLRHLNPQTQQALARFAPPQFGFNYLGRFGRSGTLWSLDGADAVVGLGAHPGTPLRHVVELSSVAEERPDGTVLVAEWTWAAGLVDRADVEDLAAAWSRALEGILVHARRPGSGGRTPSEFPLVSVEQREIEEFERRCGRVADILPTSALQQGLLFSAQFDTEGLDPYTLQIGVDVEGPLDTGLLRASAAELLRRHSSLRAAFPRRTDGDPVQVVAVSAEAGWTVTDLTGLPDHAREAALEQVTQEEWTHRFDLTRPPLVRFRVVRLGESRHRLLWSVHHALVDGWSMGVFAKELFTLYAHGADPAALPEPPSYRDYAAWLRGRDEEAARLAWKEALDGVEEPTRLVQQPLQDTAALPGELITDLDEELTAKLSASAAQHGVTLSMLMQGAWALLLGQLTGQHDVLFGAVASGRPADLPGVESMVGSFLSTLPVRARLAPGSTFHDVVTGLRTQQAALGEHRHLGLAEVQRLAGLGDLFDTVVSYNNYPMADVSGLAGTVPGLRFPRGHARVVAEYPLALSCYPGPRLRLHTQYAPAALDRARAGAVTDRLIRLLGAVVDQPHAPLAALGTLSGEERATLLGNWAGRITAAPSAVVTDLVEQWAARTPDAVAVVAPEGELTYRELNSRANRLARLLLARGVGPEQPVALALPRSAGHLVAVLGTLKAGCAFLPVDTAYPAERITYMLNDTRPTVLLTTEELGRRLPDTGTPLLALDTDPVLAELAGLADTDVDEAERGSPLLPGDAAYIIYTSGSTGLPKGVQVDHAGFAAMLASLTERFALDSSVRVLQFASYSFDASVWEWGLALRNGGAVVVADEEARAGGSALADLIRGAGVTLAGLPPVVMGALPEDAGLPAGLTVAVAGEACPPEVTARWAGRVRLFNGYGPTEAVVASTVGGPLDTAARPPIGRPTAAHRCYVLDGALRPVPAGVTGELYVAGGLARGYLHRPGLTASRFVADPFGSPGTRMYRTGDLVRWLPDGQLDYVGRHDDQVQLRGYRIELGEIEAAVTAHPSVSAAVVTVHGDTSGHRHLIAYATADGAVPDTGRLADALRAHARSALPQHMVPSAFVVLGAFPVTAQGKVDRKALPAPDFSHTAGDRAPRTPAEEILCAVFADVLGLPEVGVDDDFFTMGGHSLLATKVVAKARSALGVELSIRALFESRTVAGLARQAASVSAARPALRAADDDTGTDDSALSFAQRRLWFANRLEQDGRGTYNVPFALRLTGDLDVGALRGALADVVTRHQVLRSVFPAVDGTPVQRVLPTEEGPEVALLRVTEQDLTAVLADEAEASFDLTAEPPLRARLFELNEPGAAGTAVLLFVFHHIAFDGWSIAPLVRDLALAYRARCAGEEPRFAPLPVQYADYARWQHGLLGSADDPDSTLARQLTYWKEALTGLPEEIGLPRDFARPTMGSHAGDGVGFRVAPELADALDRLARECGATLFMVLQAAFATLLGGLGAGRDIPLGTPIAGRTEDGLDDLIGTFINTAVLRTDLSGDPSFAELVGRVREVSLAAYAHQDVPFELVVDAVGPTRSLTRHPLFQVMLVLQNTEEAPEVELPSLAVRGEPVPQRLTKFDLRLQFDQQDGLQGVLEYATELFTRATAESLVERLLRVLRTAAADADIRLSDIDLLTGKERQQVLTDWNPTDRETVRGCLPDLFAAAAERTPGAEAVAADGVSWTYRELVGRANRLARRLVALGAGPERVVGVALPLSPEFTEAVLGVLVSGAACTLIAPGLPAGQVESLVAQAAPVCLVTTRAQATRLPPGVPRIVLDDPGQRAALDALDATRPEVAHDPLHPALVAYATDPDGRLLGTVIEHGALAARTARASGAQDGTGPLTPGGLASGLFAPLLAGGTVRPSAPVAGDAEGVDDVAAQLFAAPRPGTAVRAYVLDQALRPVPPGAIGELYVGGGELARGYLARPGHTAERFVADPFAAGARMLRTGTAARWTQDGHLVPAEPVATRAESRNSEDSGETRASAAPGGLAPRTRFEEVLLGVVHEVLGRTDLGVEENFFSSGMNSIRSMHVVSRSGKAGLEVTIADVFAHQSVGALAAEVERRQAPARQAPPRGSVIDEVFAQLGQGDEDPFATVVRLKPGGSRAPLFCLHSGVGFALPYVGLARHIGDGHPIYGIQAPSISELAPLPGSVREMAAQYVELIKKVQPSGPYHLLGWSFGGCLAHEVAVQLQEAGDEVALLADLDSYPRTAEAEVGDDQTLLSWVIELVGEDASRFAGRELTPDDVLTALREGDSPMAALGEEKVLAMLRTMRNNGRLMNEFRPRAFQGRMQLFVASANLSETEVAERSALWAPYVAGGVEEHQVPCSHDYMMHPDPLALVGSAIAAELQRLHLTAALRAGGSS